MNTFLETDNRSDAYFVKHELGLDNFAEFIQYCNQLRPQINQQHRQGYVQAFIRDLEGGHEIQFLRFLRKVHKIHYLWNAQDPDEAEKSVIWGMVHNNIRNVVYKDDRNLFFENYSFHVFALEPWESVDLSKEVEKLKRELQEIKDAILYAPGGPIYQESKAHFNSTILSQQEQQDPAASYPLPKKHKHT